MISNEKIFISGGAGFIGSALAKYFLEKGNTVIIYDSFLRNTLEFYPEINDHHNLTKVVGDIRDKQKLKESIQESTYIFHLAAIAGVSKYFTIPAEVMEVNIIGTYNIFDAAKEMKYLKAIFDFSTSEIYGSDCFNASEEGDIKMENISNRRWTYATSKIASEMFGMSYLWQFNVPFIGIRPFNIYGPGQVGEGAISYLINNAIKGEEMTLTDDGSQARTFCYIDDFILGIEKILNNIDDCIGQSFNIGTTNEIISVFSIAKLIQEICEVELKINYKGHAGEDVLVRSPNIDKIKRLGYKPKFTLREGLIKTYQWYKDKSIILD
jgi:nucleoside-diphosphate-sugar epimerase